ncbi:GPI ethanolamine phosphate transferase 2, catalytic subunit-like [Babylonia areolata]|uniref:GPI ethanolamine phosphate transferase 2, catalytic subunit-like n=1 Tax=Babylonia areolata TaxID=304850 RepID=UPI003FD0D54E
MKLVLRRHLFIVFCSVSTVFSYALFLKCYFPLKQGLSGHARVEDTPSEPVTGRNGVPTAVYHRLILMVVDALRTDFVLGDVPFMPFTQQLLRDGRGVSFSAKTHLPTVTLPRIKAMTSGSIPGFVDVVLNFDSSALTEDNLVMQLKLAGKTVTFFGDDTWLRLFPGHFTRADGTTSFFVTDYTEVDLNVTRHLQGELSAEDWDVMVMHYLGLDHLGHLYAPEATLFMPKLREMDDVVHQIYSAMSSWDRERPALLVVTGDHGVSDQGGHGGASPEETNVPIVLLSPHTTFQPPSGEKREMEQIDLCPTLSALLGLPIPRNNLGQVEVTALPAHAPVQDRVRHLQLNAAQMLAVLEQNVGSIEEDAAYHLYHDALSAHSSWLSSRNTTPTAPWEAVGNRVLMGYQEAVRKMTQRIGQTSTRYDMYGIGVAIACLWMNLLIQVLGLTSRSATASLRMPTAGSLAVLLPGLLVAVLGHMTVCTGQHRSDVLCGTSVFGLAVQLVTMGILFVGVAALVGDLLPLDLPRVLRGEGRAWSVAEKVLAGGVVAHTLSLLSSSFVEEEHQTWYFFVSTFHTLLLLPHLPLCLGGAALGGSAVPGTVPPPSPSPHSDNDRVCVGASSGDSLNDRCFSEVNVLGREQDEVFGDERKEEGVHPVSRRAGMQMVLSAGGVLMLCRILRRWNQTGNKWLDVPDVGDWLVRPENRVALSLSVAVSLSCLAVMRAGGLADRTKRCLMVAALACVYLSKAASGSLFLPGGSLLWLSAQGVMEARLAYLFTFCLVIHCLKWPHSTASVSHSVSDSVPPSSGGTTTFSSASQGTRRTRPSCQDTDEAHLHQHFHGSATPSSSVDETRDALSSSVTRERHKGLWEGLQGAWLCVMCLLVRPHNVVQVVLVSAMEKLTGDCVLPSLSLRPSTTLLYCLMMGQASFFFQGNSNSLSTVDVSAGLTALVDYQPVVIGLQIAMTTYGGIVFWLLSCLKYVTIDATLHPRQYRLSEAYRDVCSAALVTRAVPLAVYTVLTTAMRYHLFVWTVFSPKLLYEGTLTLLLTPFALGSLLLSHVWRNDGKEKL